MGEKEEVTSYKTIIIVVGIIVAALVIIALLNYAGIIPGLYPK